jgi:hypothetical protein
MCRRNLNDFFKDYLPVDRQDRLIFCRSIYHFIILILILIIKFYFIFHLKLDRDTPNEYDTDIFLRNEIFKNKDKYICFYFQILGSSSREGLCKNLRRL